MTDTDGQNGAVITIKKYANRRLYNTATSSYVTLDHLCQMVKDGLDFVVYDAKSGDDITRSVLTQIIVEEESKGQNLLPIRFLRQLIGAYGDNVHQMLLPSFLEQSMEAFTQNQGQMESYFRDTFGSMFPMSSFEDMGKQNKAVFENAMQMFAPLAGHTPNPGAPNPGASNPGASKAEAPTVEPVEDNDSTKTQMDDMARKLNELQAQLAAMTKPSS
jgi:polyhydroxyalkanoate synthesis repressor PhaR